MKRMTLSIPSLCLLMALTVAAQAQVAPGQQGGRPAGGGMGGPPAPKLDWLTKLFEKHPAFTGTMVTEFKAPDGAMSIPGKMYYLDGKTRLEIDLKKIEGGSMPPGAADQMEAMGMGQVVSIGIPDKKETYLVYPGLKAYAVMPTTGETADDKEKKPEIKRTQLGKETVEGQPATKYKVVVKDDEGKEHELTLWEATDLKNFPIRIENPNEEVPTTLTFREVKFEKPAESMFTPPEDFQRYTDVGMMIRESMMKRFAPPGGAGGVTPPRQ